MAAAVELRDDRDAGTESRSDANSSARLSSDTASSISRALTAKAALFIKSECCCVDINDRIHSRFSSSVAAWMTYFFPAVVKILNAVSLSSTTRSISPNGMTPSGCVDVSLS